MKAMVTGGAGFIGSHIVDSLLVDGHKVVCVDNLSAGKLANLFPRHSANENLSFAKIDILSPEVENYIKGVEVVFHNAASKKNVCLKDPMRDLQVNSRGTLNLLMLAKKHGVKKFVHASTGSVYGEPTVFPQTEDHPLNPVSFYGVSKLAGENYVTLYSDWLDTVVLRYFHVYGSRQDDSEYGGVVAIFLKAAREERPLIIYGDGTQERSFTHVDDIVKINRLVVKEGVGGVYNCASGIRVTINQLAGHILKLTHSPSRVIYEDWLAGDIKKFDVDNNKVKGLGLEFEGLYSGLRKITDEVTVPC